MNEDDTDDTKTNGNYTTNNDAEKNIKRIMRMVRIIMMMILIIVMTMNS